MTAKGSFVHQQILAAASKIPPLHIFVKGMIRRKGRKKSDVYLLFHF